MLYLYIINVNCEILYALFLSHRTAKFAVVRLCLAGLRRIIEIGISLFGAMKHGVLGKFKICSLVINYWWGLAFFKIRWFSPEKVFWILIVLLCAGTDHLGVNILDLLFGSFFNWELKVLPLRFSFVEVARIAWPTSYEAASSATWGIIQTMMELINFPHNFLLSSLLIEVSLFICVTFVFIFVIWGLFIQGCTVNFQHCWRLIPFKYLFKVVLLDKWVVCVSLHRFSEIFLLIKYLYEPLRELRSAVLRFKDHWAGAWLPFMLRLTSFLNFFGFLNWFVYSMYVQFWHRWRWIINFDSSFHSSINRTLIGKFACIKKSMLVGVFAISHGFTFFTDIIKWNDMHPFLILIQSASTDLSCIRIQSPFDQLTFLNSQMIWFKLIFYYFNFVLLSLRGWFWLVQYIYLFFKSAHIQRFVSFWL